MVQKEKHITNMEKIFSVESKYLIGGRTENPGNRTAQFCVEQILRGSGNYNEKFVSAFARLKVCVPGFLEFLK